MTNVAIPGVNEAVTDKNQKPTIPWFTFFQDVYQAVRGGLNIAIGGLLYINTTSTANSGSGETDLMNYTIPANMLINIGDTIDIKAWGVYAANGNSKTVKLIFGGQTILTTGAISANDGTWRIEATIVRKLVNSQEIIADIISSNSSVSDSATRTAGTQTLSSANIIKITGQGSSTNDITQYCLRINLTPNN